MKDNNYNVYVVHGYTASSQEEWFPWIKRKLKDDNINVTIFDMPNPNSPNVMEWEAHLNNNISEYDKNTIFIAHSLGCISLLRYIEKQSINKKIGGAILVSAFNEEISTLPMLDSFIKHNLNINKLTDIIKNISIISSPSDSIVPYESSCEFAKQLNAKLITIENGGHFLAQEGFTEFPQVYDVLCNMINEAN